jgi:hypothetical protein
VKGLDEETCTKFGIHLVGKFKNSVYRYRMVKYIDYLIRNLEKELEGKK